MQIIFGKHNAEQLKDRYTILELETFDVEGKPLEVYCVIPPEAIALTEISIIDQTTKLHNEFVKALKENNRKMCEDLSVHLMGRFGGELDSFYEEILKRFSNT